MKTNIKLFYSYQPISLILLDINSWCNLPKSMYTYLIKTERMGYTIYPYKKKK